MAKGHKVLNKKVSTQNDRSRMFQLFDLAKKEQTFLYVIISLLVLCGFVYPYPKIAMWLGFSLAAYAAIANDSIQTIGTFIASNSHRKWWYLWLFMGLIFLITVTFSWYTFDGDVTFQRLQSKGFSEAPTSFSFLQLAAPLILLILTRLRMPVSTTFLLLNAFSTSTSAILGVIGKSLSGYFLAFFTAMIVWFAVSTIFKRYLKISKKAAGYWVILQWITSGALWSVWIMQDAANVAIFLPRSLNPSQFIAFCGFIFLGLGTLFYLKGDRIQRIVDEKSGVKDVRAATVVDLIYSILLYYKLFESTLPMSTTWLFIGLLGGRELAISFTKKRSKRRIISAKKSLKLLGKDLFYALIGLLVSMILAMAINDEIRRELLEMI